MASTSKLARALSLFFMALLAAFWATETPASRMIRNLTIGRVTAGIAVACTAETDFTHWALRNIEWHHNTSKQGAGKDSALAAAMTAWTNVGNADHVLLYAGTTTAGFVTDNQNTLVWADDNGCTGSCLALTALVLRPGQVIVESDITFNNTKTWTVTGANFDTQAVATHELGHSLGIHHTDNTSVPFATMTATYIGIDGRSLEADDRRALQCSELFY